MKSLKTYLSKAEYIMVVNRLLKKVDEKDDRSKYQGVKIPTINFKKTFINAVKDLKAINITPLDESTSKEKAFSIAKTTNSVCKKQDLHFLHFGMIYYSAKSEKSGRIQGWKIPKIIGITRQLEVVRTPPQTKPDKEFFLKFSKLEN